MDKINKYFSRSKPPCPQSDPTNPHKLCRRSDPPISMCFSCKDQKHLKNKRYYYYCATCDLEFHRGCHLLPTEIRHPFHLIHPLTVIITDPYFDISQIPNGWASSSSDSENYVYESEDVGSNSDGNHVKCKSCRQRVEGTYYHCFVCNFSLDFICSWKPPPLTIENLKTHAHSLTLFPRRLPLPCDACGFSLDAAMDQVYSCLLCNYMVHRRCIYLPHVIKITRHPHRLSHTSSLVPSDEELSCGVCRKTVDINYGQYSCTKGCRYAVHSKCATKDEVWDGKDLDGVPEEEEEEEIVEPFVRIDEETIQHFSHEHHHLKIHGNDKHGYLENKFCQACTLLITVSDRFYSCIQCDFVLHSTCACLPRKENHSLHKHTLTLLNPFSLSNLEDDSISKFHFRCDGCDRLCCGFVYKCCEKDCNFQLDVRCASLSDPSSHGLHEHPLFFNLTTGKCMWCKSKYCSLKYLECIECKFFLGLNCATFPSVVHYKHDKHPLTICYGEEKETTNFQYWCEICETTIEASKPFYTCTSCGVTLHIPCLLGKEEYYMKPNHIIKWDDRKVYVLSNGGNSRPVCDVCRRRCQYTLVYKLPDKICCSLLCVCDSRV